MDLLDESNWLTALATEAFDQACAAFGRGDMVDHARWSARHRAVEAQHAVLMRDATGAALH